jgi:hypothetical protein
LEKAILGKSVMARFLVLGCLCFLCGCSFVDRMWDSLAFWRESEPAGTAMTSNDGEPAQSQATMKAEIARLEDQRHALDERISALKSALAETTAMPEPSKITAATPMPEPTKITAAMPAPAPAPSVAAAPAPAASAAPAAAPAAPAAAGSDLFSDTAEYSVHLASYRGVTAAARGWQELKHKLGDTLGDLQPRVVAVDFNDGRGTFYRLKAGPFADKKSAAARCDAIKSTGNFCHVEDFTGQNLGSKS